MHCCSMAMTDKQLLSDHFTPWSASPYHLLHPFMQPIMPTTILVLGHIERSKQNLENLKNKSKTKKTNFWENVWFWLKSLLFSLFFEMETQKNFVFFLNGYDQSRYQKNKKLKLYLFFQHFRFGFLHWKVSKTKNNVFFDDILIDHIHSKN